MSEAQKAVRARMTPEERSNVARRAWETKRARGYRQPSVAAMTGRSQAEMSREGWETRRRNYTPEQISEMGRQARLAGRN